MMSGELKMELRQDVVSSLRELALRGASVRTLVDEIRNRLDYRGDSPLPFLWYLKKAFDLPLPEVLPITAWLGGDADREIDAEILPRIAAAKARWMSMMNENGVAQETSGSHGLTAAKERS
jgi:hypothetical protein